MRTALLLSFLITLALLQNLYAQRFVEEYWHRGRVTLENGDTLSGELKFSLESEIIQIQTNTGTLQTLTSRKVLAFEFYDAAERRDRFYYTLPFAKPGTGDYKAPAFFEVILQDDPLTLMCREILVVQTTMMPNPYAFGPSVPITQRVVRPTFYLLYKSGKIRTLTNNKREVIALLGDKENAIKEYFRNNRVRLDFKPDVIKLIEYYNAQKRKTTTD